MKILYITPWGPSLRNGGGRHCYANARALCLYPGGMVDYVGPEIDAELPDLSPEIFHRVLSRPFTLRDKAKAVLRGASTSLVSLFDEFVRHHGVSEYDLVFVETTRCGFVFSEVGEGIPTICNVHNVEFDYLGFNGAGGTRLAAWNVRKSEQRTLDACRTFLVMHDEDMWRLREVYRVNDKDIRFLQHPVCSPPPKSEQVPYEDRDRVLFFAGSLDSRFNEMGLMEFVTRCWPGLKDSGHTLVVSGGNPSADLSKFLSRQKGVQLIANPPEMEPLLRNARMLLLPDLVGTGMKLRVAEAMSLGVPVVGTHAGLRGYREIAKFGCEVESVADMKNAVLGLLADSSCLTSCAKAAREIWNEYYSMNIFTARIHHMLDDFGSTLNNGVW